MHQTTNNVEAWKQRFLAVGLSQEGMTRWHVIFEQEDPKGHQSFLEWLGIPAGQIALIRKGEA